MSVTYYVALPFTDGEDGLAPGQAEECPTANAATWKASAMSRDSKYVGALAFKRNGDPNLGEFSAAEVLKTYGRVPTDLTEL
ncbi:MAG: hypothetical protein AB7U62_03085 [Pseudolabrys sp.]